jgi:DNA repair protein RecN (Recombination protein N)
MLVELNIRNFAIIEELQIRFTKGLNILTGETGSGKSILIEAIGIILGSRTSKDLIQTGHDKAFLEGVFYIEDSTVIVPILDKYGVDFAEDNLLIITREIYLNSPTISRVNGKILNLSMLNDITAKLIDIFGQHEHQSLLDMSKHQMLVDSFGDKELIKLKSIIKSNYEDMVLEKRRLKSLSIDSGERDREIDILNFQIQEIEDARLTKDDEDNVENEYKKLSRVEEISFAAKEVINSISLDSYENKNVLDLMSRNIQAINNVKKFDQDLEPFYVELENIRSELQDLNRSISNYLEGIEIDAERLTFLEERLNLINKLKKKYGNSIEEILNFRDKSLERLEKLNNHEKELEKTNKKIASLEASLREDSENLSNKRKEISSILEQEIKKELISLNMNKVNFKVDFKRNSELGIEGYDKIEFMISTNLGEDLKPLSKIASGGEMSRIMLGFKSILAGFDKIPTMIFDEIDTGISGRTAQVVGEKIYKISKEHQIICISHLPQIAALADSHFVINKVVLDNKTKTIVNRLSEDGRIEEMARLLGGVDLTNTTIKHASEMIEMSKKIKNY